MIQCIFSRHVPYLIDIFAAIGNQYFHVYSGLFDSCLYRFEPDARTRVVGWNVRYRRYWFYRGSISLTAKYSGFEQRRVFAIIRDEILV